MKLLDELKAIEERDGLITPQAVVDFAQDPQTNLHSKFEWDNEKAGPKYRLWQARQLLRVQYVNVKGDEKDVITIAFVSLTDDRHKEGGYRSIITVLTDEDLRAKMLQDARRELNIFKKKYQGLVELSDLFKEIERLEEHVLA